MNASKSRSWLVLAAVLAAAAFAWSRTSPDAAPPDVSPAVAGSGTTPAKDATLVGRSACGGCHEEEVKAWKASHHARALLPANSDSLVADLDSTPNSLLNEPNFRIIEEGTSFAVSTEGAFGKAETYRVKYALGFTPLQQYVAEAEDGRLIPLRIAWDSRSAKDGGQRWFSLYPGEEIPPGDPLHFTGPNQNYNGMCADCHSTGVVRGYDSENDTFQTTWNEIEVSCEACHGPASRHVANPSEGKHKGFDVALAGASRRTWLHDHDSALGKRGIASPQLTQPPPKDALDEVDVCAKCHSRRNMLLETSNGAQAFLDVALPLLARSPAYFPDGQIDEEVYVWGSFLQSKMHRQGVTCSNCHDPHSNALRAEPDQVCSTCHAPNVFAQPEHSHHPSSVGCVDCHMPSKTYMAVDERHDHSFRIPRVDLSASLGFPSSCTGCHQDENKVALVDRSREWWGPPEQDVIYWLAQASRGDPAAAAPLLAVAQNAHTPEMQRAVALTEAFSLIGQHGARAVPDYVAANRALKDLCRSDSPLVRLAVSEAATSIAPQDALGPLTSLLDDDLWAIQLEALRQVVSNLPPPVWASLKPRLERLFRQHESNQRPFLDRASTATNLGAIALGLGQLKKAEDYLSSGLRRDPSFVPAIINLADLKRHQGLGSESLLVLEQGLNRLEEAPALHYSYGLALVRSGRRDEATRALRRASELAPENPTYAVTLATALKEAGDVVGALAVLEEIGTKRPFHPLVQRTLATFRR